MHEDGVQPVQDSKHVEQLQVDRPPPETSPPPPPPPPTCSNSSSSTSSTLSTPSTSPTWPTTDPVTSSSSSASSKEDEPTEFVEVVVIPSQADGERCPGVFKTCVPDEQILARCASTFSTDSFTDCCRICQQHGEEPLLELGCHCRGELAKAHLSCIEQWFGNKGSNKCEICQHVAENIPAPPPQPAPHFWVWRLGINRGSRSRAQPSTTGGRSRFHPLWAALLILVAGLLFDVLISIFLGASALPVNIIIGVLVVLGIGTAARLVVECWHERGLRRNIRRIETNLAHLQEEVHHGSLAQAHPSFIVQSAVVRPLP